MSIRQNVQNGQFRNSLAEDASCLLVASKADEIIERLLADRPQFCSWASLRAGYANMGGDLSDGKRPAVGIADPIRR
jgi:hypothetical protein